MSLSHSVVLASFELVTLLSQPGAGIIGVYHYDACLAVTFLIA